MSPARTVRGSITLEILIAFAIFSIVLFSVILLLWGSNATALADEREEVAFARNALHDARIAAGTDFSSVVASAGDVTYDGIAYHRTVSVTDFTPCLKSVTAIATATDSVGDGVSLSAWFADTLGMLELGNDCDASAPTGSWTTTNVFASDTATGVQATAVDTLSEYAYVGTAQLPYLLTANTKGVAEGTAGGLLTTYANGFALTSAPNALDATAVRNPRGTERRYVFAAISAATNQLAVIDVTDPKNPVLAAARTLANVDATGSFPQGWRLYYYDNRLYMVTRETKGAELHVFDVANPSSPVELGSGTAIDITMNDLVVRTRITGGVSKRYLYAATARDAGEVAVYDVTNPVSITEVMADRIDLPGSQDGQSVALIGTKLYVGRQSAPSGPDLYMYDASNPATGLPLLGSVDIGTGVTSIRVENRLAYLGTVKANKQIQVWDVGDASAMKFLSSYAVPGLADRGLDYDSDIVFAVSTNAPLFRMLKSN